MSVNNDNIDNDVFVESLEEQRNPHQDLAEGLARALNNLLTQGQAGQVRHDGQGKIQCTITAFDEKNESFKSYLQRLENYFVLKGVDTDERLQARLLIANLSPQIYQTLSALTAPNLPSELSYADLCYLLKGYLCPTPNKIWEQHKFVTTVQATSETVTQFMTNLKKKAINCDFICSSCDSSTQKDHIRTQFIRGLHDESIRERLLQEKSEANVDDLYVIAVSMENSKKESKQMKPCGSTGNVDVYDESVNKVFNRIERKRTCYSCGMDWPHTLSKPCVAKTKSCFKCGKIGHFANLCKFDGNQSKVKFLSHTYNMSECKDTDSSDEQIFVINPKKTPKLDLEICGTIIEFYVDTGSGVNVIDFDTYTTLRFKPELEKSSCNLYPYQSDKKLEVLGKFSTLFSHGDKNICADIHVVKNNGVSLLSCETSYELNLIEFLFNVQDSQEKIFIQYPKLFTGLGKLKNTKIHLHIDPNVPTVSNPHRRVPIHQRKALEEEVKRLEENDIVEKVEGPTPWISPIVLVNRRGDPTRVRLCLDMRMFNNAIIRERHITPTLDDIVSKIEGSVIFSKLDLNEGYHQLELDEESRNITTFSTHFGLRRYKRLAYGINSAPEKFQDIIRQTICDIDGAMNVSDDIIIFGKTVEAHEKTLHNVLRRFEECGLTLNKKKCQFYLPEIKFFGHVFSAKGIEVDPEKVTAFCELPAPNNISEARSLLGMINYCSRFIPNLANAALPIRNLTRKSVPFHWGKIEQDAFVELKNLVKNNVINSYFDVNKDTHLIVDAGPTGLAAILSQYNDETNNYNIIACASTTLNEVQKRYSQIEKEMLAVTWGVEHFELYLKGYQFTIHTDHKPIVSLLTNYKKSMSARLERLIFKLQGYNFKILHTPGCTNPSDYMSRHPDKNVCKQFPEEWFVNSVTCAALPKALTRDEIVLCSSNDTIIQQVIAALRCEDLNAWKSADLKNFFKIKNELTVSDDGILLRGRRIVIPNILQERVVEMAHVGHQGVVKTKQLLRGKVWFCGMDKMVEILLDNCLACQTISSKLFPEPLIPTTLPDGPWKNIAMDFAGPFKNNYYAMILVDEFSRYPVVEIIQSTQTTIVCQKLMKIFSLFGFPEVVKTDNGPPFNGTDFTQFLEGRGCVHRKITPYWPQANGTVERFVRTLKSFIQTCEVETKCWTKEIDEFLLMYRATPHSTTGYAPAEMLLKSSFKTFVPTVAEELCDEKYDKFKDNDTKQKNKMKEYTDKTRHAKLHDLVEGDRVIIKMKPFDKYFSSDIFEIVQICGNQITVSNENGTYTRNSSFVKRFEGNDKKLQVCKKKSPSKAVHVETGDNAQLPSEESEDYVWTRVFRRSPQAGTSKLKDIKLSDVQDVLTQNNAFGSVNGESIGSSFNSTFTSESTNVTSTSKESSKNTSSTLEASSTQDDIAGDHTLVSNEEQPHNLRRSTRVVRAPQRYGSWVT